MERTACVDIPALPLQLAIGQRPGWQNFPVVILDDDRPNARVLWTNDLARNHRISVGMTYAAARNLAIELRAAVVGQTEIDHAVAQLHLCLCNYSPRVEPSQSEPGVFWLDPEGLVALFGSLEQWGTAIARDLQAHGWQATVVVGFHRYRCYAIARVRSDVNVRVIADLHTELRLAADVPLNRLHVAPKLLEGLRVLDVHTLGDFVALPAAELRIRFGDEALELHRLAHDRPQPLSPRAVEEPIAKSFELDPPDADYARLLFAIKSLLHPLLRQLVDRGLAMRALCLQFELDHAPTWVCRLEPSEPTLDESTVLELVRLRLEASVLPAAVCSIRVQIEGSAANAEQLALFRAQHRRNLHSASRAVAKVRAAMGSQSVTRARIRAAHLPEAGFSWESIASIPRPHPRPGCLFRDKVASMPVLSRRLIEARAIPSPPQREPEAWFGEYGGTVRVYGPYRISGGWWVRTVERDYYFVEVRRGGLLWVFYDRCRRRWFLQGYVD